MTDLQIVVWILFAMNILGIAMSVRNMFRLRQLELEEKALIQELNQLRDTGLQLIEQLSKELELKEFFSEDMEERVKSRMPH